MKKIILTLAVFLCGVAAIVSGCKKEDGKQVNNVDWNVAVYETVKPGQELTDETLQSMVAGKYGKGDIAHADSLMAQFAPLLDSLGCEWGWLEAEDAYGDPMMDIVVYKKEPAIQQHLEQAEIAPLTPGDDSHWQASFKFDDSNRWKNVTQANIERQLVFMVNGKVVYAPYVQMAIEEGAAMLIFNGDMSKEFIPAEVLDGPEK